MDAGRALHCRKDVTLQPVARPFSYAGFQSKALRKLTLYADKRKSGIVTTIARLGGAGAEPAEVTDSEGFFYNGD